MPPHRRFRLERGDSRPFLLCHCWNPSIWNSGALQYRERRIYIGEAEGNQHFSRSARFFLAVMCARGYEVWFICLLKSKFVPCVSASIPTYFLVHRAMFRSIDIPIEGSYYSNAKLISTPNSVARCSYQRLANDLYRLKVVIIIWQSHHQCCHWVQCRQDRAGPSRCGPLWAVVLWRPRVRSTVPYDHGRAQIWSLSTRTEQVC